MYNRNVPVNKSHRLLKEFSLQHRLGCCYFSIVSLSDLTAHNLAKLLQCRVTALTGKGLKDFFFFHFMCLFGQHMHELQVEGACS